MTPIAKEVLNLMIARAKNTGDQFWYHTKALYQVLETSAPGETDHDDYRNRAYTSFANMCDSFAADFKDQELGKVLALEMFLRAGKHIEPAIKHTNRKRADKLIENILRRQIDDPSRKTR